MGYKYNPLQFSGFSKSSTGTGVVTSVNGDTGDVVLDKTSIGLDQVDNTSDLNKPISNATQAALDAITTEITTYELVFNNTTDWGTPSGGSYTITISEAVHLKGTIPRVQVFEKNGINYDNVVTSFSVSNTGQVSLIVNQTPDSRFSGKILIF